MPSAEDIAETEYYDDLSLLAELVQAEAGNQDENGKRLVADVVLNRVASDRFPNSIPEVIYQDKQFSTVLDGALMDAGWHMDQSDYDAVWTEATAGQRLDSQVLFFTAGEYNPYCEPMYRYGDHYFGK
ncbi:MAG: cell wall hydrolase [Lachnospiraceae bacterium]